MECYQSVCHETVFGAESETMTEGRHYDPVFYFQLADLTGFEEFFKLCHQHLSITMIAKYCRSYILTIPLRYGNLQVEDNKLCYPDSLPGDLVTFTYPILYK